MLKIIALLSVIALSNASFLHPACADPRDPGPCRAYVVAFYYDPSSNSCQRFYYGGCGGNRNRFYSYEACNMLCKRSEAPWILRPVGELEGGYDDWNNFYKFARA